ncbi:MAG: DUF2569 family protein [Opitutaceae bacterium]
MTKFLSFILLCILPLAALIGANDLPEQITIDTNLPEWVEVIAPDLATEASTERSSDGVFYLLSDQQENTKEAATYKHFALQLTTAEGVEDYSSISVYIDPDTQVLIWNQLDIIREGERINLLPNQEFITSTNQSSDNLVYDNTMECLAIIEGTKKGDTLDYAYTVIGKNPITGDRYSRWFSLNYSIPISHIFRRIIRTPEERPLQVNLISPSAIEVNLPSPTKVGDHIEYRFERKQVPPVHTDDNLPYGYIAYDYFAISDWESWEEVSEWGTALYNYQDVELKLPKDLSAALEDWKAMNDPEAQVLAALHWVQEEIRYVGITIGPHNYKPYTIDQTLARSFGDCKDKTQLLSYLLNKMDIIAYPTLVNTTDRGNIENYLPSASSFDHVITTVEIDNQTYWIDPTNSGQAGPLSEIWTPDYGKALCLREGTEDLTYLPGQGAEVSKTFTKETFEMSEYNDRIELTVYTRYQGSSADSQRRYFSRSNPAESEKDYLNFYAQRYPNIEVREPLKIEDNTERNIFEVTETYTINDAWKADEDNPAVSYLSTFPEFIRSWTFLSDTRIRTMPAAQNFPLDLTQVIEVILPDAGDFENNETTINNPWFNFSAKVSTEEEKLVLRYHYKHLQPKIAAADYPEYTADVDELLDLLGYSISHTESDDQAESGSDTPSRPHMASYYIAGQAAIIGLLMAAWLVTRKRTPPKPPVDRDLDGISGWLILPAFGVIMSPITLLVTIFSDTTVYFDGDWMNDFNLPSGNAYIPNFDLVVYSEITTNVFFTVISFALIYTFFKKRAITRPLYIAMSIGMTTFLILDHVAINYLYEKNGYDPLEFDSELVVSSIRTLIWCLYFGISERVRSTFRN